MYLLFKQLSCFFQLVKLFIFRGMKLANLSNIFTSVARTGTPKTRIIGSAFQIQSWFRWCTIILAGQAVRMICWTFVGHAEKQGGKAEYEQRKNSLRTQKSTREYFKKLFFEGKYGCFDECFLLKSNLELWIHNHKLICFPLDYMEPQNEGLVQMIFHYSNNHDNNKNNTNYTNSSGNSNTSNEHHSNNT